jgi:hypothetical protein
MVATDVVRSDIELRRNGTEFARKWPKPLNEAETPVI